MPVLTLLCKDAVPAGATLHRSLQDGGSITAATTTTGWNAGSNAIGQSCLMVGGTEVARNAAGWSTTLQPSAAPSTTLGDCWRTENPYTGNFASGNWVFTFGMRSVTAAYTGRFRLSMRIYASTNPSGAGAVQLTSSNFTGAATTASLTTTTDTVLTVTWPAGSIVTVAGQYLFVNVGIDITTAGGGTTQDMDFRVSSAAGYGLVTPNFTAGLTVTPGVGAIVATGNAPDDWIDAIEQPGAGAAAITGLAPSVAVSSVGGATRFYLSSTTGPTVSPAFAAWDRTTDATRHTMSPTKDGSLIGAASLGGNVPLGPNTTCLAHQFVSDPMPAGVAFSTADTIKMQIGCVELTGAENFNRQPICVKVYSADGTTLRATLKALGHYGPSTTEWVLSSAGLPGSNRTAAAGTALDTAYTTVAGDRLVVEVGGQVDATGGSNVFGLQTYGNGVASDLGENETDASAALNPWFEISRAIAFPASPATGVIAIAGLAPTVAVSNLGATRFYLSSNSKVYMPVTPAMEAWGYIRDSTDRALMSPSPDGSSMLSFQFGGSTTQPADTTMLGRQFVSEPIVAGIAFSTSDTIKAQVICLEQGGTNNINRQPIAVKVVSRDGTTLRATLKALGHYGPNTTEWPINPSTSNKTVADGDALDANYTTVAGDRLVVEIGGQVSAAGGTSVLGFQYFGSPIGNSDLGENETDTSVALRAWFQISRAVVFEGVSPFVGSAFFQGYPPTVVTPKAVAPGVGTIAVSGLAPPTDRVGQVSWIQFTIPAAAPTVPGTVAPGVGAIVVSGQAPTLLRGSIIAAGLGSVVVAGLAPIAAQALLEQPGAGAVVVAGLVPTRVAGAVAQPATGAVAVAGLAPAALRGALAQPGVGSITVAGAAPTASVGVLAQPGVGSITVAGLAPVRVAGAVAAPGAGAVVVGGQQPTALRGAIAVPGAGTVVVAGLAPGSAAAAVVVPGVGAVALAGLAPTAIVGRVAQPGSGAVVVAGLAPVALTGTVAQPAAGSIVVAGLVPTALGGAVATPACGAVVVAGQAPALLRGSVVAAGLGSVVVAGLPPLALRGAVAQPDAGSITLSGQAPPFAVSVLRTATPAQGTVTLAGLAPVVVATGHVVAQPGSGAIVADGQVPAPIRSGNAVAQPPCGVVALVGLAPVIAQTTHVIAQPGVGGVVVAGLSPVAARTANVVTAPGVGSIVVAGLAPAVARTQHVVATPAAGAVSAAGQQPAVVTGGNVVAQPAAGAIGITGLAPVAVRTAHVVARPTTGAVLITGLAPSVQRSAHVVVTPGAGVVLVTGQSPAALRSSNILVQPPAGVIAVSGLASVPIIAGVAANDPLFFGAAM